MKDGLGYQRQYARYLCFSPEPDALHNTSDLLKHLPFGHALIQEHTVHTSGSQISKCERQEPTTQPYHSETEDHGTPKEYILAHSEQLRPVFWKNLL